jgi:hypothetical protein
MKGREEMIKDILEKRAEMTTAEQQQRNYHHHHHHHTLLSTATNVISCCIMESQILSHYGILIMVD